MGLKTISKITAIVIISTLVLSLSISFNNEGLNLLYPALLSFFIIIVANITAKKMAGYFLETEVDINLWAWFQFGFKKYSHFKKPLPMIWLPLVASLFTKGYLWWLAILEFDVSPKPERASKRHGLYRFTEVTEWHIGLIAIWGIAANVLLAVMGYFSNFELFTKLSLYYAVWSIIPLSGLDGTKILFASRKLWMFVFSILLILFTWSQLVI